MSPPHHTKSGSFRESFKGIFVLTAVLTFCNVVICPWSCYANGRLNLSSIVIIINQTVNDGVAHSRIGTLDQPVYSCLILSLIKTYYMFPCKSCQEWLDKSPKLVGQMSHQCGTNVPPVIQLKYALPQALLLCSNVTYGQFRRSLKTFLFGQ